MILRDELKGILELNKQISSDVEPMVKRDFYSFYDENISIIQNVYLKLEKECIIIKYPITIDELGGFVYKTDNHSFCFINSNQPRAFQNFVLIHEYYHLNHEEIEKNKIDMVLSNEEESINLRERKANYYASLILLQSLRENYNRFINDRKFTIEETLCYLIDLYKVPKKSILIRLHELGCIDFDTLYENFHNDIDSLKKQFISLGLDTSILESSNAIKLDNIHEEFKKAEDTGAMLETFLIQNKEYYKVLENKLKANYKNAE